MNTYKVRYNECNSSPQLISNKDSNPKPVQTPQYSIGGRGQLDTAFNTN